MFFTNLDATKDRISVYNRTLILSLMKIHQFKILFIILSCLPVGYKCFGQCSSVNFEASSTKGCALLAVTFSASGSPAGSTYDWDLGNGFLTGKKDTITGVYSNQGKYSITMISHFPGGVSCTLKKDTYITVLPPVIPIVKAYPGFTLCDITRQLTLIDSTTQIISREWVVDGYTFNSTKVKYNFALPGNKPVSLKVTNQYGCIKFYTNTVFVNDSVAVDFCANLTVTDSLIKGTFSPSIGQITGRTIQSYTWLFPGGTPSVFNGTNPSVTYNDKNNHPVSLTIVTSDGCSYTKTRPNFIRQFVSPVFVKLCKNESLTLTADTLKTSIDTILWSLPKVTYLTKSAFNKILVGYDSAGLYGLTLSVHSSDNPPNSNCHTVIHYPNYLSILGPVASFISQDNISCNPFDTVHIINNTNLYGAPNVKYTWYFMDSSGKLLKNNFKIGPTSTPNINYVPGKYGKITVALVASSSNGCKDSFSSESFIFVSHPKIEIYSSNKFDCYGDIYDLEAKTTPNDSADDPYTYTWKFENVLDTSIVLRLDGTPAGPWNGLDYPPGVYNVFLTIHVGNKCSYTVEKPSFMVIYGDQTYYTVSKRIGCPGLTTTVNVGPEIIYPTNTPHFYRWRVKDQYGQSSGIGVTIDDSTAKITNIHFASPGIFKLTLITYVLHGTDTCKTVYEQDSAINVGINILFTKNAAKCINDTTFLNCPNSGVFNLKWNIEPHQFVHIFPNDTSKNIKVKFDKDTCYAINLSGKKNIAGEVCSGSFDDKICFSKLVSSFNTITPVLYCAPATAKFVNTSSKTAIHYLWNFGDGTSLFTDNNTIIAHTYVQFVRGDYDVTLTAFDSIGCAISDTVKKIIHISGPVPVFEAIKDKGCDSMLVSFKNTSYNVHKYYFFYDDGAVPDSINLNPHKYVLQDKSLDSITFHPVLQSKDDTACPDFYVGNITIYRTPTVSFTQDKTQGCIPLTVSFNSTTTFATSWKWDFDSDGIIDDSIHQNPIFTYTKSGNFTPTLVVLNGNTCATKAIGESINIGANANPGFLTSIHKFCGPQVITFTNTSSKYKRLVFDYGDGSAPDTNFIGKHLYGFNPGKYPGDSVILYPSLTAYNIGGCPSTFTDTIVVYKSSESGFKVSDLSGCNQLTVLFTDTTRNRYNTEWDFDNNGVIDARGRTAVWTYSPGIYAVKMRSISVHGCVDSTVKVNLINVDVAPKPDFRVSDSIVCYNTAIQIYNLTQPASVVKKWQWIVHDSSSTNDTSYVHDPLFKFTSKGSKTIQLTVTDSVGCTSTIEKQDIFVEDNKAPTSVNLLYVSVKDSHSVIIVFSKADNNRFKAYKINRIVNGTAVGVGMVTDINDTFFIDNDTAINTLKSSYCYSVQSVNDCDALSFASFTHCTILLSGVDVSGPVNELRWSSYLGWSANSYQILRAGSDGIYKIIGSVDGNVLSYNDSALCDETYCYKIQATSVLGYNSNSNSICLAALYNRITSTIYMRNVSDWNDRQIKIDWDTTGSKNFVAYLIDRYTHNTGWINNLALALNNSYIDNNVDINDSFYVYRIRTLDKCGYTNSPGNKGNSILLAQKINNDNVELNWNRYYGWRNSVKNYKLQVQLKNKLFTTIATTTDSFYTDDSVYHAIDTAYCYRVIAYENTPGQDSSISNKTCAILPSKIFVPNAFTPGNNDSLNDLWKVSAISIYNAVGQKIKSFNTRVFNRWGTLVFETNDLNKGWDGTFKGKIVPIDVYIYLIDAESLDGKQVHLKGNLTIVK